MSPDDGDLYPHEEDDFDPKEWDRNHVTIPRAQHEALMAAVKASTEMMDILKRQGPGWLEYTSPHQGLVKALAALRGGPVEGIDPQVQRPPLPEEIAGLIKRAVWALGNPYNGDLVKARVLKECLDAIRALAQENERIEAIRTDMQECNESLAQENERLKTGNAEGSQLLWQRIRELEAERGPTDTSRRYALDVAEWCERELVAARATGNLETRPLVQNAELIVKALREFGGAT